MTIDLATVQSELEGFGVPPDEAARMAKSDLDGATPQRARHAILHGAWRNVVDPEGRWIAGALDSFPAGGPLRALVEAGADPALLTKLVRSMQFELLAAFLCLLDEGTDRRTSVCWRLHEVTHDGQLGRPVLALHESLTASDPTGEADGWM